MKKATQTTVEQHVHPDVIEGLEAIQKGWSAVQEQDNALWQLERLRDTSAPVQSEILKLKNAAESNKLFLKEWVNFLVQPSMKSYLTKEQLKEWILHSVQHGFVDLAKNLLRNNPGLLKEEYTAYGYTENLYELMMRCDAVIKDNEMMQQGFFKQRHEDYQVLEKLFKEKGLRLGSDFVKAQQKESLNPAQSVENTVFLSSVHKGMHVLLKDNGYFKKGMVRETLHSLRRKSDQKAFENWVEQLADPEYCKAKAQEAAKHLQGDPVKYAALYEEELAKYKAALGSFRAAIASGAEGARESSDTRVKLYAAYSAEFEHKKFNMLDIFVVCWQALNRKDRINPEVRENLLGSWIQAMYEATIAYDDPTSNRVLPGTREGCAQAMVNPTIGLFAGQYPGIEIKFLNAGYIANRATALVMDFIEKGSSIGEIKQWMREGGMPETLYQHQDLDLKGKLEIEYKEFGDKATPMIQEALELIEYREVPDRLKDFVVQKSFSDFFIKKLKDLSVLDKLFVVDQMTNFWGIQKVIKPKETIETLWDTNPLLQALVQKIPTLKQEWDKYLEQEVLSHLPKVSAQSPDADKKRAAALRDTYKVAELGALQKFLCDSTLQSIVEKVSMIGKFKKEIAQAQALAKQFEEKQTIVPPQNNNTL